MVTSRNVPGLALTSLALATLGCLLSVFLTNSAVAGAPTVRDRAHSPNASGNLTLVGQIAGAANAVALNATGDRAYLAVGPRVMALDVSAPAQPRLLGQSEVLDGVATRLAVGGDYVFAGNADGGVWVLDVADPAVPRELGFADTPSGINDLVVLGDFVLVADDTGSLRVIDFTDLARPQEVVSHAVPAKATGVAASTGLAFVTYGDNRSGGGLQVVDVSDPGTPQLSATVELEKPAVDVALDGNLAYVATTRTLHVFDVADPAQPRPVGSLDPENWDAIGPANRLAVASGYAYLATGISAQFPGGCIPFFGRLLVIDVWTPERPVVVGHYQQTSGFFSNGFVDVAVMGEHVYLAERVTGLVAVNVANPAVPSEAGRYETGGLPMDVATSGSRAYLAHGWGLRAVDLSDPVAPQLGHDVPSTSSLHLVKVADEMLFASQSDIFASATSLYDAATMAHMSEIPHALNDVAASREFAYTTTYGPSYGSSPGFRVYDVRDPSQPVEVAHIMASDDPRGVAVADQYAYVTAGGLLRVIDVSVPANPRPVGQSAQMRFPDDVAVVGSHAYVTDDSRLVVFDVTVSAHPRLVGELDLQGPTSCRITDLAVDNGLAYVVCGSELRVIDVSAPSDLREDSSYPTIGLATGVAVAGDHVFVSANRAGLLIWRREQPPVATPTATVRTDEPTLYLPAVLQRHGYSDRFLDELPLDNGPVVFQLATFGALAPGGRVGYAPKRTPTFTLYENGTYVRVQHDYRTRPTETTMVTGKLSADQLSALVGVLNDDVGLLDLPVNPPGMGCATCGPYDYVYFQHDGREHRIRIYGLTTYTICRRRPPAGPFSDRLVKLAHTVDGLAEPLTAVESPYEVRRGTLVAKEEDWYSSTPEWPFGHWLRLDSLPADGRHVARRLHGDAARKVSRGP